MKSFLARRWFIFTLIVGISLAVILTDTVDRIIRPIPPKFVVSCTLFLMAWTLESGRLYGAVIRPGPAIWAVCINFGLLPLMGWGVSYILPAKDFGIGLLVISSVPCTIASAAIWTRLAKGNEATALLVTMFTNCTGWFFTTSWLTLTTGAAVDLQPIEMMKDLALVLVLPVTLGQLARLPKPTRKLAEKGKITFSVISRLLVFLIILKAVVRAANQLSRSEFDSPIVGLIYVALACVGVHLIALFIGYWSSRFLGFSRENQIAVAFACSQKTMPVSLVLVTVYYETYALAVVPVLFYHVSQLMVDTLIAERMARVRSGSRS